MLCAAEAADATWCLRLDLRTSLSCIRPEKPDHVSILAKHLSFWFMPSSFTESPTDVAVLTSQACVCGTRLSRRRRKTQQLLKQVTCLRKQMVRNPGRMQTLS